MSSSGDLSARLSGLVVDVPDFPRPGVTFRDITPLLASPEGFAATVQGLVEAAPAGVDAVVAVEARGFLVGAPVAAALGVGVVPVRKPGKLPRERVEVRYDLEYGTDAVAMHADALPAGTRVLVVDDVLATGGTLAATADLVGQVGAEVAAVAVVLEIGLLGGRDRLRRAGVGDVRALLSTAGG